MKKNQRLLLIMAGVLTAPSALAISGGVSTGSVFTTGNVSDHFSIFASSVNPAAGDLALQTGESWRIGYLPSISANLELGDVRDFSDDLEELSDIIDDPSLAAETSTEQTLSRFNSTLQSLGSDGYMRANVSANLPFFPMLIRVNGLKGTFNVDIKGGAQTGLRVLDDELFFNTQNNLFETNTALYLKSAIETEVSVGYSQRVWQSEQGQLLVGGKLKWLNVDLSKQVIRLMDLDGEAIEDVIEDEYDENLESTGALALDVGVLWNADRYRLGLTLVNANSPSFEYGAIGQDCASRSAGSIGRNGCEISRRFVDQGRISANETHEKPAYFVGDASIFLTDRWSISGSVDVSAYNDAVGFEHQWVSVATSYRPESIWFPALRLGYQKNQVGTELDTMNVGVSFFKTLNLDVQYSPQTVIADGDEVPRQVGFSLSLSERF